MAERIKTLFRVKTPGAPWNSVINWGPDPPQTGVTFETPLVSPEQLKLQT